MLRNQWKNSSQTLEADIKFTTLDDIERTFTREDLWFVTKRTFVVLRVFFGGKNQEFQKIPILFFLESAYFNPVNRQSDIPMPLSVWRGIDPTITEYALKRAALLIQEVAGGEIGYSNLYQRKLRTLVCFWTLSKVAKIIGRNYQRIHQKILVSLI
jgi:phenylalanyl-tRNA synthetase beta chain